jgi:hypothetical protein
MGGATVLPLEPQGPDVAVAVAVVAARRNRLEFLAGRIAEAGGRG